MTSQTEFERIVLFSAFTDATNILFREALGREAIIASSRDWLDWRNAIVRDHLPGASRAIRLEQLKRIRATPSEECDLIVEIPVQKLEPVISSFLRHLLRAAKADGMVDDTAYRRSVNESVREVSGRVARMWERACL